ncbi:hypothetical protein ACA910_009558 [Epithemia clementina (nom. ined.)]
MSLISKARKAIQIEERFNERRSFSQTMDFMVMLTAKVIVPRNNNMIEQDKWQKGNAWSSLYDAAGQRLEWLGLEVHLNTSMAHESNQQRFFLQSVVRDVQAEYQRNRSLWTTAEVELELRHVCRNFSQPLVLLAHWIFEAAWEAAA